MILLILHPYFPLLDRKATDTLTSGSGHFSILDDLAYFRHLVSGSFPLSFDSFLSIIFLLFQCPTLAYLSSADLPLPFRLATPTGQEASIGQRQDVSNVLPSCVRPPSRWKEGFNTISTTPTLESVGICPASTLRVVWRMAPRGSPVWYASWCFGAFGVSNGTSAQELRIGPETPLG